MKPFVVGAAIALVPPIAKTDSLGLYRWPVAAVVCLLLVAGSLQFERWQARRKRTARGQRP